MRRSACSRCLFDPLAGTRARASVGWRMATGSSNLPAHTSSLIGREGEIQAVSALLCDPEVGLVTLTGTGGGGKTRLALAVAAQALTSERFTDGVWLVELASSHDPLLVADVVATSVGVRERAGRSMRETLLDHLRSRALLLILDNCEHLVQAVAELADDVLRACPGVGILATSREPIRVAGERLWQVPPLRVPDSRAADAKTIAGISSVQLFVERAKAVRSTFTLDDQSASAISGICARLAGLPLAIELAAARAHVLTADEIVARLDDAFRLLVSGNRMAPARQQTLRATLDWSYDLLEPADQELFERLSVFAGGFDLEAAEVIWSDSGTAFTRDALEVLTGLVDRSLVTAQPHACGMRYGLLEPVRQYAQERLHQRGSWDASRSRHANHYLHLTERAEDGLKGPLAEEWQARLQLEHDNVRAFLRRCIDANEPEIPLRTGSALRNYWQQFGFRAEGRRWLEDALALPGEVPPAVRGNAVQTAAVIAVHVGDYRSAKSRFEQAADLWRGLGDTAGLSSTLVYYGRVLAAVAETHDDYERGKLLMREGWQLNLDAGNTWWAAQALFFIGISAWEHAELDVANTVLCEAEEMFTALGDSHTHSHLMSQLGGVLRDKGELSRATEMIERSLSEARAINCLAGCAQALYFLGGADRLRGDRVLAAEHALESALLFHQVSDSAGLLNAMELIGGILTDKGLAAQAVVVFSSASAARQRAGMPRPTIIRQAFEGDLGTARAAVGNARFTTAWAEGSAMSIDQLVAYARTADQTESQRSEPLSQRERQVIALVTRGYTNRQIAEELVISERTADGHVNHILSKLGLSSRAQAAVWAVEHQLVAGRSNPNAGPGIRKRSEA